MTSTAELGISPVLLQAITQTLSTSAETQAQQAGQQEGQKVIATSSEDATVEVESSPHILSGMNQPIASLSTLSGDTVVVVQNEEEIQADDSVLVIKPEVDMYSEQVESEPVRVQEVENKTESIVVSAPMQNMGSVLSAIASHLQQNRKRTASAAALDGQEPQMLEVTTTSGASAQPLIYSLGNNSISVPSPVNDVVVSAGGDIATETVIHQVTTEGQTINLDEQKKVIRVLPDSTQGGDQPVTFVLNSNNAMNTMYEMVRNSQGLVQVAEVETRSTESSSSYQSVFKPCPICGDRISGYHYGIFSCESCKGFFKRTVQNKKAFICHRKGQCVVNIANRKKCPACRFKQCLLAGMKIEAIRSDRMRGGRSSYDGCSPSIKHKAEAGYGPKGNIGNQRSRQTPHKIIQIKPSSGSTPVTAYLEDGKAVIIPGDNYLTVLDVNKQDSKAGTSSGEAILDLTQAVQPQTPQVLEDLLGVETVVNEEEGELACCEGKLREGDPDPFGSLLHLADHCLYKIVRWARNLPDFADVSTDDQILLLQHSWADLLCLSTCWKSIQTNGALALGHGRYLDLEMAKAMGFADIIQRMLDFTEQLKRLDVDVYEFVAMKALILMTPDVNGLKQEDVLRAYQNKISESLMIYTATHFVDRKNKFCEMLARIAEVSRTCFIAKERLTARQAAGEVPQFSLLSELLKGDIVVHTTEST